jgi:hypothetical protein
MPTSCTAGVQDRGNAAFLGAPDPGRFASLSFTGLCKPDRAAAENRNQDAKAKRNSRRRQLRRHGRGVESLPDSGLTSSTPHRVGPSARPGRNHPPNSPAADGTGSGLVQILSSQHEGDGVVVRRFDAALCVARTRPQSPANEGPINRATPFKQAVCWSGRGARGSHCILKPSPRKLQRHYRF